LLLIAVWLNYYWQSFGESNMQNHHDKLIQRLRELGFTDRQIGALTYSSEKTVQNWLHRRTSPSPLAVQQLARVIRIVEDLRKLINPVAFNDWFFQANQFLRKSPYQAIIDGEYDKIQQLTFSLMEGSFA
jgi:transcriptional regulator with XRE-family HTH domain